MAKGAYIGVDGVARKVKNGYIGIDGIARKIKKAYIGVDGVAKLCWSAELFTTEESADGIIVLAKTTASLNSAKCYCADGFTFDEATGKFVLTNPTTVTISYASYSKAADLVGKYVMTVGTSGSTMYKHSNLGSYARDTITESKTTYYRVCLTGGYTKYTSAV